MFKSFAIQMWVLFFVSTLSIAAGLVIGAIGTLALDKLVSYHLDWSEHQ